MTEVGLSVGVAHARGPVSLLTIGEVCAATRLSRASIYRLMACGGFPKPVKIGLAKSVWLVSEIEAWIAVRAAAR